MKIVFKNDSDFTFEGTNQLRDTTYCGLIDPFVDVYIKISTEEKYQVIESIDKFRFAPSPSEENELQKYGEWLKNE